MALATCNAYASLTAAQLGAAVQGADCQEIDPETPTLTPDEFQAGLLAGLLAANTAVDNPVDLGSVSPCDIQAAVKNLHCAVEGSRVNFPNLGDVKFEAVVAYLINELLCTLNAPS